MLTIKKTPFTVSLIIKYLIFYNKKATPNY
nr:MAG TPA: hypothetical protein [Caudoviricetes sp.]